MSNLFSQSVFTTHVPYQTNFRTPRLVFNFTLSIVWSSFMYINSYAPNIQSVSFFTSCVGLFDKFCSRNAYGAETSLFHLIGHSIGLPFSRQIIIKTEGQSLPSFPLFKYC